MSVHAHRTEGVVGSEGREEANGVGGGDVNGDGDGAGTKTGVEANEERKMGIGMGVETLERTQDMNEDGSGDGNDSNSGHGDADGIGNEDGIGESGGEAKKRKKPHKRRDMGNGGDLSRKRKNVDNKGLAAVAADPDNLKDGKEAGGETQGTLGLSKNCSSKESVSPLSRLIRGFRSKNN